MIGLGSDKNPGQNWLYLSICLLLYEWYWFTFSKQRKTLTDLRKVCSKALSLKRSLKKATSSISLSSSPCQISTLQSSVFGARQHSDKLEEGLLEGAAAGKVDEEVDGGVEHQGEVVEAGEAPDPASPGSWWGLTAIYVVLVFWCVMSWKVLTSQCSHYIGTHSSWWWPWECCRRERRQQHRLGSRQGSSPSSSNLSTSFAIAWKF